MPVQLWETTMDPERRLLKQLVVEDAVEANVVFSSLMGVRVSQSTMRPPSLWTVLGTQPFVVSMQVDDRKRLIQNAASNINLEKLDI